jgi:iron complex transport system substrate-binding protein
LSLAEGRCILRAVRTVAFVAAALCTATLSHASRQVTDQLGRTVTVPDHPQRIVCLIPSVVDDVYALGAGAEVIAVSDYTRFPIKARQKPSIGLPLSPSLEKIVALHPDLVLGSGDSTRSETVEQLEHLGVTVFMLNPHGVDGILASITSLGGALNRQPRARELVSQLRARVQAVRLHAQQQPVISVFMPIWYSPVITVGSHAFITEVLTMAGARSVTEDIAQEWPQVSLETVVARQPQALILMKNSKMTLATLLQMPGWKELPAVAQRRVYYTDERMELPSPVLFDAMEDLAKQLHP